MHQQLFHQQLLMCVLVCNPQVLQEQPVLVLVQLQALALPQVLAHRPEPDQQLQGRQLVPVLVRQPELPQGQGPQLPAHQLAQAHQLVFQVLALVRQQLVFRPVPVFLGQGLLQALVHQLVLVLVHQLGLVFLPEPGQQLQGQDQQLGQDQRLALVFLPVQDQLRVPGQRLALV
jgi:hypothetical protein